MRVLAAVVVPPHLANSGAVNAALALSRHLDGLDGIDVDVALMATDTADEPLGEHAGVLRRRKADTPLDVFSSRLPDRVRTLFYRSDIAALIADGDYDVVHLHNPMPALEMRRIARAARRAGRPTVVSTHGFVEVLDIGAAQQLAGWQRRLLDPLIRRPVVGVARDAAMIFALSPADARLVTDLDVPPHRVVVVPNGVERSYLEAPPPALVDQVCERFGLAPAAPAVRLFFLANHTANKGLDVLIEAISATEVPFELIVGGKRRNLPYEAWAERLGPRQRLVVTDRLSDDEIRVLHHLAELFVFPSRADTLPLVVLEAMASATAVLSTTVGGIPFQVADGCGRLVPPDDAVALRAALEALVGDRRALCAMGDAARRHVVATFDWERSARIAADAYANVVASFRGVAGGTAATARTATR